MKAAAKEDSPPNQSTEAALDALNQRQQAIIDIVRSKGFATIEWLAEHFQISAQTVRRDIIFLDSCRLLQRFHGGAGVLDRSVRLGYAEKRIVALDAKAAIGRAAAALIPDGATVFLDVGTTVEAAARALCRNSALRVFTNSLASALHLANHPGIAVMVTGGALRGPDGSLVGDGATAMLRELRFDVALIGMSGWDDDGAPMDFDVDKIAVKRVAIARASQAILLCDSSKFGRSAVARINPPDSFSTLVSDQAPPEELRAVLQRCGVKIILQ